MLKKYYNEIYSLSKYYKQPLVTYDYFLSKFIKHSKYSIPDNFDKYECHEMLYYQIRNILIKKDNEIERIYNNGYFRY